MGKTGLKELKNQGLLEKKKLGDLAFCEDCMFRNATRVSIKTVVHQTKQTLDYVHSNLWEPSRVPSHGGARYFLPIIDDYCKKVWIYIFKNKSNSFAKLKE